MQHIISNIDPSKGKSYEKYLIELVKHGKLDVTNVETCTKARDILTKHMQYKKHLDPKYKNLIAYTLEQLDEALSEVMVNISQEKTPFMKTESLKIYEYGREDYAKYKKLYSETKWCTTNESTYKEYIKDGNLYIINYCSDVFQWHPATWSLMDSNDKQVDAYLVNILLKDFPMEITAESEYKLLERHISNDTTMRKPKVEFLNSYGALAYCMFISHRREPLIEDKILEDYFTTYYYQKYVIANKKIELQDFEAGYRDNEDYIFSRFHLMWHYAMVETKTRLEFFKWEKELCNELQRCTDRYESGKALIAYVKEFKLETVTLFREAIKNTPTVYNWIVEIENQRCHELEPFIKEDDLITYWEKFIPKTERWPLLEQHIMKEKSGHLNDYSAYLLQHRMKEELHSEFGAKAMKEEIEEKIIITSNIGYFYAKQHGLLDKHGDKVNIEIFNWNKIDDIDEANTLSYHIKCSDSAFHCLKKFPDLPNKQNVRKLITDSWHQHEYVKLQRQRVPEFEEHMIMNIGYYINAIHGGVFDYDKALKQYPFITELEAKIQYYDALDHARWIRKSNATISYWELREKYPILKKCEIMQDTEYRYIYYAIDIMKFTWDKAYFIHKDLRDKIHVKCLKANYKDYYSLV